MMECQPVWDFRFYGSLMLMIFFRHITQSDAYCTQTTEGVKRFGLNCTLRCHCLNTEQCDFETGACMSGCDYEWTGHDCQYNNVALEKESRHSSNLIKNPKNYSNLANDRDIETCSFTAEATSSTKLPWWALWFPDNVTFKELIFVTKDTHLPYFPGFSVTVQTNVSGTEHRNWTYKNGELCYQHNDSIPSNTTVHVKCGEELIGQQLRIQLANISTQLVLCDVRVYGACKDRMWGDRCEKLCGFCRNLSQCDANNGHCLQGCELGYKDTLRCEAECDQGTYGWNCTSKCSDGCRNNDCYKGNGICKYGCNQGYQGNRCDQECHNGTYGINCQHNCSSNCDVVCNKTDGTCSTCKSGWKGNNCTLGCALDEWGRDCSKKCGKCSKGSCDKINGSCSEGCKPGYKPTVFCNEKCHNGTYGINCQHNCSSNCDVVCNKTDGTCSTCKPGWKGNNCTLGCALDKWGKDCSKKCGKCSKGSCDKINGSCSEGCKPGYKPTVFCNERVPQPFPVVGAVGGVSGAVVCAAVVVTILVLLRKRRRSLRSTPFESTKQRFLSPAITTEDKDAKCKRKNENRQNVYCNASEFEDRLWDSEDVTNPRNVEIHDSEYVNDTPPVCTRSETEVLVSKLKDYVNKGLGDKKYFAEEFQKIPYGMQYPATVATNPRNIGKNKYKSMYAYDHSRVVLKKQDGSDYINASNVMGYTCGNSYIAAQGPIQTTLDDFWRMIWEKNIRTIIMATNLSEEGKMKCLQYWPEISQTAQYGYLSIVMESEDIFTELVVRRWKVSHEGKPEKQRIVTQFHYRAWPDKGVPRCTSSLLHFWHQVRKHDARKAAPWLVHCSAGVGRTGTFIALDILYEEGTDKGSIDIYQCVSTLREQRVNMVQTKEQYKFLHSIMVEALVLAWKPIIVDKFTSVYDELKEVDQRTGKTQLLLQYESLNDEPEVENNQEKQDELYSSAKKTENRDKNRYDNILAPNEFRPFLYTRVPGCTDYINAIYIPGYRLKHSYIITQTPLITTAVDCCRLLIEEEVKVIVTFDDSDGEEVGEYLPERGAVNIGPFTSTFVSEEDKGHSILRKFEVKFQSQKHSITQLIFKHWLPLKLKPSNANETLFFLEEIERLQRLTDNKPILIQCLNGAEKSGLVAVLLNILERVRFQDEVSIIQVVRQLKVRRQQIIPNFEQYKFCHDVLLSHIQSNSAYANM